MSYLETSKERFRQKIIDEAVNALIDKGELFVTNTNILVESKYSEYLHSKLIAMKALLTQYSPPVFKLVIEEMIAEIESNWRNKN